MPIAVYNDLYIARNSAAKLEKNIKNFKKSLSYTDRGRKKIQNVYIFTKFLLKYTF